MADRDEDGGLDAAERRARDEAVERLTEPQRERFERRVSLLQGEDGPELSVRLQTYLARIAARNLPPIAESRDVALVVDKDRHGVLEPLVKAPAAVAFDRGKALDTTQYLEPVRPGSPPYAPRRPEEDQPAKAQEASRLHQGEPMPSVQESKPTGRAGDRDYPPTAATPRDPLQGLVPQRSDYRPLDAAHAEVAKSVPPAEGGGGGQPPSAPALLSVKELQEFGNQLAALRKTLNYVAVRPETEQLSALAQSQEQDRARTMQQAGGDQEKLLALLGHQHLADRVGVQARWMVEHMQRRGLPGADYIKGKGLQAIQTARAVGKQREAFERGRDRQQEVLPHVVEDQQRQSAAQEAARGGRTLTDAEKANAPADAKPAIERTERAAAAREVGVAGKEAQNTPRQGAQPGNGRGGGRSR